MDKIPIEKIKKYIKLYNDIKDNKISSSLYTNTESETSFAIHESDSEVVFAFFISKKSLKYIKEYVAFKEKLNNKNEIERSALAFEQSAKELKMDKFLEYCLRKNLNNPFRNFNLKGFLDCPNEFDRRCYYDFFFHKIKFYMHSGFVDLYNTIAPEVMKQLFYYMTNTKKKIIFIGFSFSSVLAQLAYLVYFLKYPTKLNNVECYLYSTPNIGNKKYQKFFETLYQKSKNRRLFIINCDDDVIYNMFSKRFGFHFMKSLLLIKRESEKKKIYTSKEYERIIEQIS